MKQKDAVKAISLSLMKNKLVKAFFSEIKKANIHH
ncbi:hypothetical protein GGQ92_002605 [Gracilibacillus halotolerans]|uniref:Uncharacterized protein n=1 Tax=Gracilibacillus halotolerans TaxID=74386 RepID=A0A841RQZ7_9BACI|nr:hypothetical protein [Gracilibacillus halotolerans]